MSLIPGTRVGPYEVIAPIGAGGMGEVYRARDTRLDRTVALKVLAGHMEGPEVRQRFEREARTISSLNHPNICTLYDVGSHDGADVLVLEDLEGETLAARLKRGPLMVAESLRTAGQIADALAAAHEKGVVHRDLKPANVMLTHQGNVKVLDFGLAKLVTDEAAAIGTTAAITMLDATRAGQILGTCSYMSPEQVRGYTVDRQTDIWAFGCVVFEMLTGTQAFSAPTASDTMSVVLTREPDYSALPAATPSWLVRLLRFCLAKEQASRLQDIRDAGLEIVAGPVEDTAVRPVGSRRNAVIAALCAVLALAAGMAIGIGFRRNGPETPPTQASVARFAVPLPEGQVLRQNAQRSLAISADGRQVAYVTAPQMRIYLRQLSGTDATPVPGTDRARSPFFSPDGRWLAFWRDRKLFKVALQGGGAPIELCNTRSIYGASWTEDDRIVFGQAHTGIFEVSANGGEPKLLVGPGVDANEIAFESPSLLPGGRTLLFTVLGTGRNWDGASIVAQDLMTGQRRVLIDGGSDARYLASGHIVFVRGTSLYAITIDPSTLTVRGSPVPVLSDLLRALMFESGAGQFDVSQTGTLVHVPAVERRNAATLVWVDRNGVEEGLPVPEKSYYHVRLSPDGLRIVADTLIEQDLWIYEISRSTMARLTSRRTNLHPVWTADGKSVIFDANLGLALERSPLDGSQEPTQVASDRSRHLTAVSASPDGRTLAVEHSDDFFAFDIGIIALDGNRTIQPLLASPEFREMSPVFSPDGRWLAYVSNETGQNEVYVRPYPSLAQKWLVSNGGGVEPLWSRDGREIFYRTGLVASTMMAVAVETATTFVAGQPRRLFASKPGLYTFEGIGAHPVYDVSIDGKRFVMAKNLSGAGARTSFSVALNWFEELNRVAPGN